jgi:hypothetical protein
LGTRLDHRTSLLAVGLLALAMSGLVPGRAAAQGGNPYGMDIHSPVGAELTLVMDDLQTAGIGWAHVAVIWPYVESSRGHRDWSVYDAIVAAAQARHVKILATILYTPPWAAATGTTWTAIPDTSAWMDFCGAAARRYRGAIDFWGVWNEPNLAEFWSGSRQQYIDLLLKPAADAIHAANPGAQVGGPALAHLSSAQWYAWLDDVIAQAGDRLDFVTHHVYDTGGNRKVTSKLNDSTLFGGTPELWSLDPPSVREVLRHAGWFGRPFWLTETGWQSQAGGEALEATYYGGMLSDWFTNFSGQTWIDKIFFYEMIDFPQNNTTWGILHADGTPKPAYNVYRAFIAGGQPSSNDDAQLVASTLPKTMDAGQTIEVSLTFRNSGASNWTNAAAYKLGAVGDTDPFAAARQLLAPSDAIAPGQQKTFTFAFTAPTPGSYATHWQMLREGVAWFGQELSQQVTVNSAPAPTERTLPLQGGRFAVTVSWHDLQGGNAGFGRALPGTDDTGTFWFFSPANTELVIKVLDARAVNRHFWFFYGALSDVEYWITATDLLRGTTATYYNPPGNLCGKADTSTFGASGAASPAPGATGSLSVDAGSAARLERESSGPHEGIGRWVAAPLPAPSAGREGNQAETSATGTCVASGGDLCLLGNRFQVSVGWATQGMTGTGAAAVLSDETGTFAFFDPRAIDLVVKVIDGRALTGKFWFFYGALSDVAYTITLTDTVTGAAKQYHNQQGNLCGLGDTGALN